MTTNNLNSIPHPLRHTAREREQRTLASKSPSVEAEPVPDALTEEPPVLQGELHLWRHQIQHQDAQSQGPLLFDDTP